MHKNLIFAILFFLSFQATAQEPLSFEQKRLEINKYGMTVLGSWALVNIASGVAFSINNNNLYQKKFWQMNAMWNTVNLALAAPGLFMALKQPEQSLLWADVIKEQNFTEKIFLFNTALDVAYITAGFWMYDRSKYVSQNNERWKGWGHSIIIQGSFLFVFDAIMYALHHQHAIKKFPLLSPSPNGIGMVINF
jgi:hypothetical protein